MFVLILVSLLSVSLAYRVGLESRSARNRALHAQLRAQAASAVAVAVARIAQNADPFDHPFQAWHTHAPLASEDWLPEWSVGTDGKEPAFSCDYRTIDEEGKLNLSRASGEALERIGLSPEQIAALFDWMDGDDDTRNGGAESDFYLSRPVPYRCKNAPLEVLEELMLVRGFTANSYLGAPPGAEGPPGAVALLTCLGEGRLNINTAPLPVLKTLPLSDGAAEQLDKFRGYDELSSGKLADHVFTSAEDIDRLQGLSSADKAVLKGVARFKSEHYRVSAVAVHRASGRREQFEALVRVKQGKAEIVQWRLGP
jgi:type II secretory pathway component PulK